MFTVFAAFDRPRLRYVLDWVLGERLGLNYVLTHDPEAPVQISYGHTNSKAIFIPEDGLLRATDGTVTIPETDSWSLETLDFDVLSAVFLLLSRAEEYSAFEADSHSRYPARYSVLSRKNWLSTPVVDVWVEQLRNQLNERFNLAIPKPDFAFQPTYDIDIAYSYLHKGFRRTIGGVLRDLKNGRLGAANNRLKVLSGKTADPYDAFDGMHRLHQQHQLQPVYFMLAAQQSGPFDKNISPSHPAMRALAQRFALEGTVGIHPSYTTSEHPEKTAAEKNWLEAATGLNIIYSRQHYIRLRFPDTYRQLLSAGITHDWSMGYPDALGFRAGTSHSFYWYDLECETQTILRVHPFCFMDTTSRDYLGLSAQDAFQQLQELKKNLMATGGRLTTVFHNFSLGTATDRPHWRAEYERWIAG